MRKTVNCFPSYAQNDTQFKKWEKKSLTVRLNFTSFCREFTAKPKKNKEVNIYSEKTEIEKNGNTNKKNRKTGNLIVPT